MWHELSIADYAVVRLSMPEEKHSTTGSCWHSKCRGWLVNATTTGSVIITYLHNGDESSSRCGNDAFRVAILLSTPGNSLDLVLELAL